MVSSVTWVFLCLILEVAMEIAIGLIAVVVIAYLIINGRRNSDPLNRKCAAEICEYLATAKAPDPADLHAIFMTNARYQAQAMHVVSMVPVLLIKAGYPKDAAMNVAPLIRAVAITLPK
jgi:hypothetical protein